MAAQKRKRNAVRGAIWMTVIGAGIGVAFGLAVATALTATGFTDIQASPTGTQTRATPTPSVTSYAPEPSEEESGPQPELNGPDGTVPPGTRFALDGQLPSAAGGATLQVQVKDADRDWMDFPVTVTVREGGAFSTELWTSRTGERQFRLVDRATGEQTPPVTVRIG